MLVKKPIVLESGESQLTSDAGLLPVQEFGGQIRRTQQFVDILEDPRESVFTKHSFTEMTRSRIFGILADYEVENGHDVLRNDPVFKRSADRPPDGGHDLAS